MPLPTAQLSLPYRNEPSRLLKVSPPPAAPSARSASPGKGASEGQHMVSRSWLGAFWGLGGSQQEGVASNTCSSCLMPQSSSCEWVACGSAGSHPLSVFS